MKILNSKKQYFAAYIRKIISDLGGSFIILSEKLVNNNGERLSWRASRSIKKTQVADPTINIPYKSIRNGINGIGIHPVRAKAHPIAINQNNCILIQNQ